MNYAGVSKKELDEIRQEIEKCIRFDQIIFEEVSAGIAANCGPGTFGFFYQMLE